MKIVYIYRKCGVINEKQSLQSLMQLLQLGEDRLKKKNQACTGFEPLTSATLLQCSTH